mgnify:CR=1 FL=1
MKDEDFYQLIRQLIEAELNSALLLQFTIWVFATSIAVILGQWLSGYAKRKGETHATKEDIETIIHHLSKTTETVERVKQSISQADWIKREWKTLKRIKLEELTTSMVELSDHQQALSEALVYETGTVPSHVDHFAKISMLCEVYFPEFKGAVLKFRLKAREIHLEITNARVEIGKYRGDLHKQNQVRIAYSEANLKLIMERDELFSDFVEEAAKSVRESYTEGEVCPAS